MSDFVHTIKLSKPVKIGSEEISELNFKEANAGHFEDLKPSEMDFKAFMGVASKLTGQTMVTMRKMSPSDLMEVTAYVGKLLLPGQAISEEPSV